MKYCCLLLMLCKSFFAQGIFSSQTDLENYLLDANTFYEIYLQEQVNIDDSVGLANGGAGPTPTPNPYSPPPNPSAPPFISGNYLPFVLVNNSGYSDDQVYFLITGKDLSSINSWGSINPSTGVVTLQNVASSDNSKTFTVALANLPLSSKGRVVYVPQTISGLCWFSIGSPLSMTVINGNIVQPNPTNSSDVNYTTNYDVFEYDFQVSGSPQIACDATAVSFFSLPLYGYLANATSAASNTGLYQPRSYIMSKIAIALNGAAESSQWNKLLLKRGSNVLRVISTMKSMSIPSFDSNYLDNASAYGYSYLSNIWYGASAFYQTHPCNMTVTVTNPSTATYNYVGTANRDGTFNFVSTNGGPALTFLSPVNSATPTNNTSYLIFAAQNLTVAGGSPQPTSGTAADAVSKLFEEALIAGLIPTTDTLSLSYLSQNQSRFYTVNSNLSASGQSKGPWYDLYSKSLHALGSIYTYGFDEPLWPNVLLTGPFISNSTYIGITIGNAQP